MHFRCASMSDIWIYICFLLICVQSNEWYNQRIYNMWAVIRKKMFSMNDLKIIGAYKKFALK